MRDEFEFVEDAMKNYTQVYVKNSFEAAETYCKAFGAEITREFKNEDNTAYRRQRQMCIRDRDMATISITNETNHIIILKPIIQIPPPNSNLLLLSISPQD